MLKKFEVVGFKNFSKKISIDFSDVHDYKFNPECITNGLISKGIIYGKNSVGKTNLGLALFDIVAHLSSKNVTPKLYDYYLNSDNTTGTAWFHYVFLFNEDEIDYIYTKNEKRQLVFETLSINHKLVYQYDYDRKQGEMDELFELAPSINMKFQDVESILKYVMNNTVLDESHPLRKMMQYISNMLWFRSLDENRYIGYKSKSDDYYDFILEQPVLNEFESLLRETGLDSSLDVRTDVDGKDRLYIKGKTYLPFFSVASSGTKALYTFFYWYKTASEVSLLFIDEFDAFYHYELAETIVKVLERMSSTQVLLTSHNTNLLTNRIMRPDCYFILANGKITAIINATSRELREGHNLEKLYMSGEFNG